MALKHLTAESPFLIVCFLLFRWFCQLDKFQSAPLTDPWQHRDLCLRSVLWPVYRHGQTLYNLLIKYQLLHPDMSLLVL